MNINRTRQDIYNRIRLGSKDSFILDEMKKLGFWQNDQPTLTEELINKEVELQKELQQLVSKSKKYDDREKMVLEMRKERMKAAKLRREETKAKNLKKKEEKAKIWTETKNNEIIYLGEDVSKGLQNKTSISEKIPTFNLPNFENVLDLANALNLNLGELKYLSYNRKVSKSSHYFTYSIPKKSGGQRIISAPKSKLKKAQTWINDSILSKINHNENAHGFIKNKSIVSNALPHLNQEIVINLDLKDFFPTITYKRIKGMFVNFGYSEQIATILAMICSHAHTEIVELDRVKYYVQKGERVLPQGSPASPSISNIISYKLDIRLTNLSQKYGFIYTRYADDLTFSCKKESENNIAKLLKYVKLIIIDEKLILNDKKTSIMRKHQQQKVTGIVVNEKPNISRINLRKFRALLHNIETNGWQNQQWGKAKHLINAIDGYICFIKMVNLDKAKLFRNQLDNIIKKHGTPVSESIVIDYKKQSLEKLVEPKISLKESNSNDKNSWWDLF